MALSVIPWINLIWFVVSIGYPFMKTVNLLYESGEALCGTNNSYQQSSVSALSDEQRTSNRKRMDNEIHWLVYWVIYSLFSLLEQNLLFFIVDFVPLYTEIKTLFFFWLGYSQFRGAGWLWFSILEHRYHAFDNFLVRLYNSYLPMCIKAWISDNIANTNESNLMQCSSKTLHSNASKPLTKVKKLS